MKAICKSILFSAFIPAAVTLCLCTAHGEETKDDTAAMPTLKQFTVDRTVSKAAKECIDCHAEQNRGIVADWAESRHAHINVSCIDCHAANAADPDVSKAHSAYSDTPVSAIVSPKDCSRCHPFEAAEYDRSKHAQTLDIVWKLDPWMNDGMNNSTERITGCQHCHGSVMKIENGIFDPQTWPNVGVGRINPDGSKGSCSSCHTRHKFSLVEARKPDVCGQCTWDRIVHKSRFTPNPNTGRSTPPKATTGNGMHPPVPGRPVWTTVPQHVRSVICPPSTAWLVRTM